MICNEIGALKRGTRILQILSYIYIFYSVYHMYVYLRYISYIIYIIYMYISDHLTVQNMPIAPNLSVKATFFTMTSRSCMTQLIFTSLILHPLPFPLLTLLQHIGFLPHYFSVTPDTLLATGLLHLLVSSVRYSFSPRLRNLA